MRCPRPSLIAACDAGEIHSIRLRRVRRHVRACPTCRRVAERVHRARAALALAGQLQPPRDLLDSARAEATARWLRVDPDELASPRWPVALVLGTGVAAALAWMVALHIAPLALR